MVLEFSFMVLEFRAGETIGGPRKFRAPDVHKPVRRRGKTGIIWIRRVSPARMRVRLAASVRAGKPGSLRRPWPVPRRMKMLSGQTFRLKFSTPAPPARQ
jgi:hypothetical protein